MRSGPFLGPTATVRKIQWKEHGACGRSGSLTWSAIVRGFAGAHVTATAGAQESLAARDRDGFQLIEDDRCLCEFGLGNCNGARTQVTQCNGDIGIPRFVICFFWFLTVFACYFFQSYLCLLLCP